MAPKPKPEMDERVSIPLDPELAIRALLKVDPDAETKSTDDRGERERYDYEPTDERDA